MFASDASTDLLGQRLGNYQVIKRLGAGGMGEVYEAMHVAINKRVAIKTVRADRGAHSDMIARFFNEARATSDIHHPGIIEVFDFGQSGSTSYLVMELLVGETLTSHMQQGPLKIEVALGLTRQIASALAAAHESGIVHRDLKPDNIFLVPYAELPGGLQVKVLDFGIAKLYGASERLTTAPSDVHRSASLTATGALLGTPYYMSPEHWSDAGRADARSDVYSLGCILYEMLVGRPPFIGATVAELAAAHLRNEPARIDLSRPDVPPHVIALCDAMLAKDPAARPASMQVVLERCEKLLREVAPVTDDEHRAKVHRERDVITHLRIAALLTERCKAIERADTALAGRLAVGLVDLAFKNNQMLGSVASDNRDLRRGELQQLFPEIRSHLESAYKLLLVDNGAIQEYERRRTEPMTTETAEVSCKALVAARPDVNWDRIRQLEDASITDAGTIGRSTAQKFAFAFVILAVLIVVAVFLVMLVRSFMPH